MKNIGLYLILALLISFVVEITFDIDVSTIPGISLKNLSIYMMIIFLFFQSFLVKRPLLLKNRFNMPIILFVVYCFLSLFFNYLFDPSIYTTLGSEIINFKNFMDSFIIAILVFSLIHDYKSIKLLLISLVVLLFILNSITIIGNFGVILSDRFIFDIKHGRVGGAFGSANEYAAYIALFIPLCINSFYYIRNMVVRFSIGLILVFSIYSLLLAGSRGGLLAFFVGTTALIFFNAKRVSLTLFLKTVTAFFVIGILVTASFQFLPEISKKGIKRNIYERATYQTLDEYSSGRLRLWKNGMKLFVQNPLFGKGWNTFVKYVNANSHNDYVLFLTTLGLAGFVILLWILYCLYSSAINYRKASENNKWYFNSYLASFCSFAVSMFFVNMRNAYLFFFIYTALTLKMGYIKSLEKEDKSKIAA